MLCVYDIAVQVDRVTAICVYVCTDGPCETCLTAYIKYDAIKYPATLANYVLKKTVIQHIARYLSILC